jgi:hypothetical protein
MRSVLLSKEPPPSAVDGTLSCCTALAPCCHPFVQEIVSACWADDPAQRPSFDELNQRFNEARMAHASFREEPVAK